MDEDTTKEIQGIQDQLTSLLARKRKREDVDLEIQVEWLRSGLTNTNKRWLSAIAECAELSKKNQELQAENELLGKSNKEHQRSLDNLNIATDALEQENETLRAKLKKFEKYDVVSKNALSNIKQNLSLALGAVVEIENDIDNNFFSCRLARW
jgi:predicted nuclease with TOPRIM domain